MNVSTFVTDLVDDESIFSLANNIIQWYGYLVMGPISVILTLNRFTAVVFLRRFKAIWSFRRTVIYLVPVVLGPFAVNAKSISKIPFLLRHDWKNTISDA
uniref:7TM_GPCR_Srx domain-containing protein n=1 Tax=Panagrellus redivivus TaxID=6233 RepID=A0A7E4VDB5_PANRE